ncbi:hypothetical protein W97_00925 [Coniosporium apollinis CBS 100218]|uniref:BZIP domain-containing protein n=1 Tax=Coniosporium apollinis (strain CBS 100218) TaxID=1168221 RepID=R7YIU2_CONA1|nr:uncharacterized protein W97_00925 [Coniosporium apollinis CBS 100218]EON61709.1 hypothetical protein W97_00925 [Coniosporium apollinis CBS 100218]
MPPDPLHDERQLKTPAHTLDRVRNNQRRHRARRREYIAFLEGRLKDTEGRLAEALTELAGLRAELESYRHGQRIDIITSDSTGVEVDQSAASTNDRAGLRVLEEGLLMHSPTVSAAATDELLPITDSTMSTVLDQEMSWFSESPLPITSGLPLASVYLLGSLDAPPAFDAPTSSLIQATPNESVSILQTSPERHPVTEPDAVPAQPPASEECCLYLPPSDNESTTLCTQAYAMIEQQNFRGLDVHTIHQWLWAGFRKAKRTGEGCRVENGLLLALLDLVSGA